MRAEHFPLLVSFFYLAFKQQDKISYMQSELQSLLGDFLYGLERGGIKDYSKSPLEYISRWAELGYLRRYYEAADEPVLELSPSTESALKWLEDLNKQEFVGTHSRLLQFFHLLKQIVSGTGGPEQRMAELEAEKRRIEMEMQQIREGKFQQSSSTEIKENYFLAEETAKRLLADFRQVEENFRLLDMETRQTIVKSSLAKGDLLDNVFARQDHLWNTDQGKSFKSFWEFLMSERMQRELEELLLKINELPEVDRIKKDQVVDKIKMNLVDAGDKVNRSNDGLIEQLRKFVEQKNLMESRHIMHNIEQIEALLLEHKEDEASLPFSMSIGGLFKPDFIMGRPLFRPPAVVSFSGKEVKEGTAEVDTGLLFEQFYVDLGELRENIRQALKTRSQIALDQLLEIYPAQKGVAEILGYLQIATSSKKHLVLNDQEVQIALEAGALAAHDDSDEGRGLRVPVVIFNR